MDTKEFEGGALYVTTAGSAANLSELSARYIYGDEVDRWENDVGQEGDPVVLAETRATNFGRNAKIYFSSSPTYKGASRIADLFESSDQRYYYVPCPTCGHMQVLEWDLFADMQVKAALSAYMQNKALYSQLKNDSRDATGILDKNLSERREASSQKWAEMAQSMDDAMRSVGDALRPVTDTVAEALTKVTKGITSLSDSAPGVVTGIAAVGGGLVALKGLLSSFKIAKGLLNVARGSLGGKSGEVQKVFVTNAEDGNGGGNDAEPKGKAGKALSLVETGLKAVAAFKGEPINGGDEAGGEGDKKPGKFDLIATGLKVVSIAKDVASGGDEGGESGSDDDGVKKVFVVNAGAMGGGAGGPGETRRRKPGSKRNPPRRRPTPPRAGRPPRPPVPRPPVPIPRPPIPPVPVPSGALSKLGGVVQAVGKIGKAAKMIPGGSLMEAGAMAFETYGAAKTKDEKAEGYATSSCSVSTTATTGRVVHGPTRVQLDPAHAQRIIGITDAGDQGLIALRACQAYAKEVSTPK